MYIQPNSVTKIDNSAFSGCENLISINIPECTTKIGDSDFKNCASLTHISIPDSLMEIGNNAFWGCNNLTVITYKGKTYNANENIDDLYDAINLKEKGILIEGGIQKDVSSKLTEVNIPDGVTIIENAFRDCTNLMSVTLPNSVHTIDKSAFNACKNVKVTYKGKSYNYEQIDDLYDNIYYNRYRGKHNVKDRYQSKDIIHI